MTFERLLDHSALDAFSSPVNQAYLAEARLVRSCDVFLDHRCDIARLEGMKVDGAFDRNMVGHVRQSSPDRQLAFTDGLLRYCRAW
jgi:hypothetical protein